MTQAPSDKKDYLRPYEDMKRVARDNRIHKAQRYSNKIDIFFTITIIVLAIIVILAIILPYYLL